MPAAAADPTPTPASVPVPVPVPAHSTAPSPAPSLLVSIHDVAPASAEATRRWLADLGDRNVRVTLLVIPGPWRDHRLSQDPDLIALLHRAASSGHELALHGWCHRAGPEGSPRRRAAARLIARGAAEFAALDQAEAAVRIAAGLAELDALGIQPAGFHPPGWLASPGAVAALRIAGLRYTTSHLFIHDLTATDRNRRRLTLPALSHRPGGTGEAFAARLMRGSAATMVRAGRSFRVALHPDDLTRPGLRETTLDVIDATLAAGFRSRTYSDLLTSRRAASASASASASTQASASASAPTSAS